MAQSLSCSGALTAVAAGLNADSSTLSSVKSGIASPVAFSVKAQTKRAVKSMAQPIRAVVVAPEKRGAEVQFDSSVFKKE